MRIDTDNHTVQMRDMSSPSENNRVSEEATGQEVVSMLLKEEPKNTNGSNEYNDTAETANLMSGANKGHSAIIPMMLAHNGVGDKNDLISVEGANITFKDLTYTIPICRCPCTRVSKEKLQRNKPILNTISGIFRPGLNAIMGPSGSGKTSLLDVLANRKDPDCVSGQVLINGCKRPSNFNSMMGYVIQENTLMGMLSVRENISFSASLRMPKGVSKKEREAQVNNVIWALRLKHCADTRVGTALRRGISGGEKKRTSIAMALVTSPRILFLDEPTTGLDSAMAQSIMFALRRLSTQNTTVVFTMHQPRFSIFRMIDTLHLLLQGSTVYHGPASHVMPFFAKMGYTCEMGNNPADFILDVVSGYLSSTFEEEQGLSTSDENSMLHLIDAYEKSDERQQLTTDLKQLNVDYNHTNTYSGTTYEASFMKQVYVVYGRAFFNMVRNPQTLGTQLLSSIILALLIGVIYFQVDDSYGSGIQNRIGAFFFITMNHVFGVMSSVDTFIDERVLFIHENISGYYRVSSYFIAKLFGEVIPNRALPTFAFTIICYWMIGLRSDMISFVVFSLTLVLASLSSTAIALLASATAERHAVSAILASLMYVLMMLFSGLLVNIKSLGKWLQWLQHISIFRYTLNALAVNELKGVEMCNKATEVVWSNTTSLIFTCKKGNEYLEQQGIPYSTVWDLLYNLVMLGVLCLVFLIMTYIQLRRIKKLT